jgi:AcrR family transcriptional regulator
MAIGRRARGTYAKTPERRAEILDAALHVFGDSGFLAGSLRDVADRAGMSQAGLLHHFGSKAELLSAVLEHRDEVNRSFFNLRSSDALSFLRGLVQLSEHNAQHPGIVALYIQVSAEAIAPDHPAHVYFRDRFVRIRTRIVEALADAESQGLLVPGTDREVLAAEVLALSDGLQLQWIYADRTFDLASRLKWHLQRHLTVDL